MQILFQSDSADPAIWEAALRRIEPAARLRLWPEIGDPAQIDMALVWRPPPGGLAGFDRLRLVQLISAGADQVKGYRFPPGLAVARLIEPGQVAGMVEYALHAVLHHHRDFDRYAAQQAQRLWLEYPRIPARRRSVGVMGLGALGAPVAQALAGLGFQCHGWSRRGAPLPGVTVHAGAAGLPGFLASAEIVLALLPLSPETCGMFGERFFAAMRPGGYFVNLGRGAQLDVAALGRALSSGHLAGATLDVLETEPPAADDPIWTLPNLRLTPHVATSPDPESAAEIVLGNYRRVLAGQPPLHPVTGFPASA